MKHQPYTLIRGRHPFVTIEELRRDPRLLVEEKGDWAERADCFVIFFIEFEIKKFYVFEKRNA